MLRSNNNVGNVLSVAGVQRFVTRNPLISASYLIGITVALLGRGFSVDSAALNHYQSGLREAASMGSERLRTELMQTEQLHYNAKGWFFACDESCQKLGRRVEKLRQQVEQSDLKRDQTIKSAKAAVGIWSVFGVDEIRGLFWRAWDQGTAMAQRMTMYDSVGYAFGSMFGSRKEENLISVLVQLFLRFVVNLTVGLVTSVFIFLLSAIQVINSYGPDIFSAIAFYFLLVCAAASTLVSFLGLVYAGTVVGIATVAKQQAEAKRRIHYD
jgi:hypothetical protein